MNKVTKAEAIDILEKYIGCHEASEYLCSVHPECNGCPYSYDFSDMAMAIPVAIEALKEDDIYGKDNTK